MSSTGNSGQGTEDYGGTPVVKIVIMAFCSVAFYNVIELNILILDTFKHYRSLYFWSTLLATWGIFFHNFAFVAKFFNVISNDIVNASIITVGWYAMVTGQAIVLWSRMHIVTQQHPQLIRNVLIMICVNAVCLHIPTTVLTFTSNDKDLSNSEQRLYLRGYNIMEKIQMTGFFIQEVVISCIFLYFAFQMSQSNRTSKAGLRLVKHTIAVNILVIILDICLVTTEYCNLYSIEVTLKGMIYSIKLKSEFMVLNRLREYITGSQIEFGRSLRPSDDTRMTIHVQREAFTATDLARKPTIDQKMSLEGDHTRISEAYGNDAKCKPYGLPESFEVLGP